MLVWYDASGGEGGAVCPRPRPRLPPRWWPGRDADRPVHAPVASPLHVPHCPPCALFPPSLPPLSVGLYRFLSWCLSLPPSPLPRPPALPPQAIAFEDSPSGVKSAVAAGLLTIGVATGHAPATLTAAGAALVIADYTDAALGAAVRRWLAAAPART